MRKALAATVAALVLAPGAVSAYSVERIEADNVGDFVIEPAKIEVAVDPGQSVERSVSITNRTGERAKFRIVLEDFIGTEDGSAAVKFMGDENSPYSFRKGIIPEVTEVEINQGDKVTIPVTVAAPGSASPGGYYTSVIVSTVPDENVGSTGAQVVSRAAQLIFVRVNGDIVEDGSTRDFRLSPPGLFRSGTPYQFEVLFENRGNVHLAPYGRVVVKNLFNQVVGTVPVDAFYAMPKSLRYRQFTWDKSGLFGYYRAELELNRDVGEDQVDKMQISFIVIPWVGLGIALLVAAILAAIITYIRRNFVFRRRNA